jgi:hypothetical protein
MGDGYTGRMTTQEEIDSPEPRWPAVVAVLVVGGLYAAIPSDLSVGPRWLQLACVIALVIPTIATHHRGNHRLNAILGHAMAAVNTLFLIWSLIVLVRAIPSHKEEPVKMLQSALSLWVTNVLVFAHWYWRLDAGGPNMRDRRAQHKHGAFLFPQMEMEPDTLVDGEPAEEWSPQFVDYLFLAFNTSTALSPTDSPVLSRWAKILTMVQASISLAVIVLLAARAVNIL